VSVPLADQVFPLPCLSPPLAAVATMIDDIRSGRRTFDQISKKELASAAQTVRHASKADFATQSRALVENVARFGFAASTPSNARRALRAARLLAVVSSYAMSPRLLAEEWQAAVHGLDLNGDVPSIKAQLKVALGLLADHLADFVSWTVILAADNVNMRVSEFSLGDVRFYNPRLVEMNAMGLQKEGAEGPPDFFSDPSGRAVVKTLALRGDRQFAVEAARTSFIFAQGLIAALDESFNANPNPAALAFHGSDSYHLVPGGKTTLGSRFYANSRHVHALTTRFDTYTKPMLVDGSIEPTLREKYLRAVRLTVDATAAATAGLFASALASIWTAFEVLLLDEEMGDRGKVLARRLSSFAVGEDALRADDVIETSEGDADEFVVDCMAGSYTPTQTVIVKAIGRLKNGEVDATQAASQVHLFGAEDLTRWRLAKTAKQAASLPPEERARRLRERVDEVVAEVREWYRLRNDIVHGGYGATSYVKDMYDDLRDLFRNVITNYAYNAASFKTCQKMMTRIDDVYASRTGAAAGSQASAPPGDHGTSL